MRYVIQLGLAACSTLALLPVTVQAAPIAIAEVKRDEPVDFEKEILPIMKRNCLACHNASDAESDLVLETPQTILKGGALGPAVEPGKADESLLLKVAAHIEDPIMPPADNKVNAKNLTPEELGLIKLWINQGAKGTVSSSSSNVVFTPLPPGVNPVYAAAITRDGQYAAAGRANQIFIYHVPTGREVGRLTDPELISSGLYKNPGVAHRDLVQSLAFNREGTLLASGGFQVVKLWERPQNVQLKKLELAGPVAASAVSADRKLLAVATGKSVQLYDLTTGKPAAKLEGHAEDVTALAFSPDSAKLFTGSADKTVRVWTVADGKEQGKLETPQPVAALTVVGDGSKIATGGGDAVIRLWNIADLSKPAAELLEKELTGHSQPVTSLITQPNAPTQIVSGSTDGTVRQWSTESAAARTLNHGGPVVAVAISPDGQKLVSASSNKIAKLWNATNGQQIAEVKGDLRAQKVVADLTADVALAQAIVNEAKAAVEAAKKDAPTKAEAAKKAQEAVAAAEKEVKAKQEPADKAKAANEAAAKTLAEADEAVKKATEAAAKAKEALDQDANNEDLKKAKAEADKALADAQAKQKDATTKLEATKKPLEDAEKALTDAKRSLDSAQKALELAQNDLKKAEEAIPASEKQLETAEAGLKKQQEALAAAQKAVTDSEQPWQAVAFSADGTEFALAGDDKLVHTYAAADGKALDVLVGHDGVIRSLVYAGPSQIVSAADDKAAIVWETNPEWKLVRTIGTGDAPLVDRVIALDFSPDGKLLATGGGEPSRSGEVKIWNVADGKLVRELTDAHSDTVFSVKFSPQGDMLASGAADKFLKVWNVGSGELIRSYEGHTHHVLGVSWKFDSKVLATAGADQVIKVWDVATGEQKRTITGFAKQLTAIEFVATTPEVVATGGDKQVHRRNVDSGGAVRTYSGGTDYMYTVAVSADGTLVIAGGEDSVLRVWKGADGQVVHNFEPPKDEKADGATAAK